MNTVDQKNLYNLIKTNFNLAEIREVCFNLGIDYENVPGEILDEKVQGLILFCQRHGRLQDLVAVCQKHRPHIEWSIAEVSGVNQTLNRRIPKHIIILASVAGGFLVLIFAWLLLSARNDCNDLSVGQIMLEKKVIEVGEKTKASVTLDNPEGRAITLNWSAVFGTMEAGLNSSYQESVYISSNSPGKDTITVELAVEGCETIRRQQQISIVNPPTPGSTPVMMKPDPTMTPSIVETPTATPIPTAPTASPDIIDPSPTRGISELCLQSVGPRWGPTLWDLYQERLGCALTQERRIAGAFQMFENGIIVWKDKVNNRPEQLYALYSDGAYKNFSVEAPEGFHESDLVKGAIGYVWLTNHEVQKKIGNPLGPEDNATDFAVQEFMEGIIFYFLENEARNYVLFKDKYEWLSHQG